VDKIFNGALRVCTINYYNSAFLKIFFFVQNVCDITYGYVFYGTRNFSQICGKIDSFLEVTWVLKWIKLKHTG
jgi:hypothetical protein